MQPVKQHCDDFRCTAGGRVLEPMGLSSAFAAELALNLQAPNPSERNTYGMF